MKRINGGLSKITPALSRPKVLGGFAGVLAIVFLSPLVLAQLTEPRATSTDMQSQMAVQVDGPCLLIAGVVKPPGCDFKTERSLTARGVAGDTARLHRLDFKKGIKSPLHNHPDEEIFYILSGQFKITTDEDTFVLSAGDILMIPAFVSHQFEAIVDSSLLEVGGPGPMLGKMRAEEAKAEDH